MDMSSSTVLPARQRFSYKKKYLKYKSLLDKMGSSFAPNGIDYEGIKQSLNDANAQMTLVEDARLNAISHFNQVVLDMNDYVSVGDMTFDAVDTIDPGVSLVGLLTNLRDMNLQLMERFAFVSEAYKEMIYNPSKDAEELVEIITNTTSLINSRGLTENKRKPGVDLTNIAGIGIGGKKVHFTRVLDDDNESSYAAVQTSQLNKGLIEEDDIDLVRGRTRVMVEEMGKTTRLLDRDQLENLQKELADPRSPKSSVHRRLLSADNSQVLEERSRSRSSNQSGVSSESKRERKRLQAVRPEDPAYQARLSQLLKKAKPQKGKGWARKDKMPSVDETLHTRANSREDHMTMPPSSMSPPKPNPTIASSSKEATKR